MLLYSVIQAPVYTSIWLKSFDGEVETCLVVLYSAMVHAASSRQFAIPETPYLKPKTTFASPHKHGDCPGVRDSHSGLLQRSRLRLSRAQENSSKISQKISIRFLDIPRHFWISRRFTPRFLEISGFRSCTQRFLEISERFLGISRQVYEISVSDGPLASKSILNDRVYPPAKVALHMERNSRADPED